MKTKFIAIIALGALMAMAFTFTPSKSKNVKDESRINSAKTKEFHAMISALNAGSSVTLANKEGDTKNIIVTEEWKSYILDHVVVSATTGGCDCTSCYIYTDNAQWRWCCIYGWNDNGTFCELMSV